MSRTANIGLPIEASRKLTDGPRRTMEQQGGYVPGNVARFITPEGAEVEGEISAESASANGSSYPLGDVRFLVPVAPSKVICVGLNYLDHIDEIGMDRPQEPLLFLKPPSSLIAHEEPIVRPPDVHRLDYEGELTVVIGRRASRVAREDALEYVDGLTIANDVTAREFQVPGSQWTKAKGFDTFAPVGPCVVRSTDWAGLAHRDPSEFQGRAVVQH